MAVAVPTTAEAPAEDSLSLGGVSARKALLLVGTATLLVVSLVLLAPTFADLSATWDRLHNGSHGWLALAFAVRGALVRRPRDPLRRRRRPRRPRAHRPARRAADQPRRQRRDAPVRERRRRRDRADRVGDAALRHGARRRGRAARRLPRAALRRLHGRAAVRRPRPLRRRAPRRRLVRDHGRARDPRRHGDRARRRRPVSSAPARAACAGSSAPWRRGVRDARGLLRSRQPRRCSAR